MNLIIIRHGQTAWNMERKTQGRTDIPLDETGIRQALKAAERLHKRSLTAVISSPLLRAMQTAQCIAAPHGLAPVPHDALIEQDVGGAQAVGSSFCAMA